MKTSVKKELDKILDKNRIDHPTKILWENGKIYKEVSDDFLTEFQHLINWTLASAYGCRSESFIKEFRNRLSWSLVAMYQKLSEDFIKEFKDDIIWYYVPWKFSGNLSEDFIKEFQDKVNWNHISLWQSDISDSFLSEFRSKLDLDILVGRKIITYEEIMRITRVTRFDLIDI
jgi:hypothetical protein